MRKRQCTPEQIAEARRMNAMRIPWAVIGERFGVKSEIIRRYAQRGYRESLKERAPAIWGNRQGKKWSDEDTTKLLQLRYENMPWDYIVAQFPGRSRNACEVRVHYQTFGRTYPVGRKEERLARKAPEHSRASLTAIICGDPAPGRSALERTARRKRPISLAPISIGASA